MTPFNFFSTLPINHLRVLFSQVLTVDQYAASVIREYQITQDIKSPGRQAAEDLIPLLEQWGGERLLSTTLSGAYAKGTAISLSSDIDIFFSLKLSQENEVRKVFWQLFEYLGDHGLQPHTRNVSLQVVRNGARVDLLPAWPVSDTDQILYHREPGNPFRTRVAQNVHLIAKSGRTQEICALKIWRERHRLDFPSFYLELVTLRALEHERYGQLAENVFTVLRYLSTHFLHSEIHDPANSENIISDELAGEQKKTIVHLARQALEDDDWEKIIW